MAAQKILWDAAKKQLIGQQISYAANCLARAIEIANEENAEELVNDLRIAQLEIVEKLIKIVDHHKLDKVQVKI